MWFKKIFAALTKKERITFVLALAGTIVSFAVVMGMVIAETTRAVPAAGGAYTEGMLGQPEYINPVIASSQTDLDLVKMVYSNLGDLSDSITPSADQKTWDVRLKQGLTWQDGQQLTSDDVIFTVQSIQDPDAHSPLYESWQGVTVSRVSELEVQFTLSNPYAFFDDTLNNLYVLPKHLFADTPPGNWHLSDYNLKPVGSGPYQFVSYNKNSNGFISSYQLAAWNGTIETHPLIQNFNFDFFSDENALVQFQQRDDRRIRQCVARGHRRNHATGQYVYMAHVRVLRGVLQSEREHRPAGSRRARGALRRRRSQRADCRRARRQRHAGIRSDPARRGDITARRDSSSGVRPPHRLRSPKAFSTTPAGRSPDRARSVQKRSAAC